MENVDSQPLPGSIIKTGLARKMMKAYVQRMVETKEAFDKLPAGTHCPFDPQEEALGWVFHRRHVEKVLFNLGADDEFVVVAFGVGPKQQTVDGESINESPDVTHCIITPARKTGDTTYLIKGLALGVTDAAEFGAEQGNTCCHGKSLIQCASELLSGGVFEMIL